MLSTNKQTDRQTATKNITIFAKEVIINVSVSQGRVHINSHNMSDLKFGFALVCWLFDRHFIS